MIVLKTDRPLTAPELRKAKLAAERFFERFPRRRVCQMTLGGRVVKVRRGHVGVDLREENARRRVASAPDVSNRPFGPKFP